MNICVFVKFCVCAIDSSSNFSYVCGPEGTVTLEREWAVSHSFFPYQSIVQVMSAHRILCYCHITAIFYTASRQAFYLLKYR